MIRILYIMRLKLRPAMRLANDLLGGPLDLLRLLARTKHLKFTCWDLMCIQWLAVSLSPLRNFALDIAPDHASGERPAGWSFGFTKTSGPYQAH